MREELLAIIEKNSRIDLKELAGFWAWKRSMW